MAGNIERGVRVLIAGVILLVGCEKDSEVEARRAIPEISSLETLYPKLEDYQVITKPDIKVLPEDSRTQNAKEIIAPLSDRIPASGYLAKFIKIKIGELLRGGVWSGEPSFDPMPGIDLLLAGDFMPESTDIKQKSILFQNHKELLEWVVVHEFGHLFSYKVSGNKSVWWGRFPGDIEQRKANDPIWSTFAQIINWEFNLKESFWYAYEEDSWNPLVKYCKCSDIEEAFAEYFAASVLHPELLSQREKKYFSIIHTGLRDGPKQFIREIRGNPQILLR